MSFQQRGGAIVLAQLTFPVMLFVAHQHAMPICVQSAIFHGMSVRLSVRLAVTLCYCIEANALRPTPFTMVEV